MWTQRWLASTADANWLIRLAVAAFVVGAARRPEIEVQDVTTIPNWLDGYPHGLGYMPGAREWNEIYTGVAPHETAGVVRAHRCGVAGYFLGRSLGLSNQQLFYEMRLGMDDESEAHRKGQEIYDDRIIVCSGCSGAMTKEGTATTRFVCVGCGKVSYSNTKVSKA